MASYNHYYSLLRLLRLKKLTRLNSLSLMRVSVPLNGSKQMVSVLTTLYWAEQALSLIVKQVGVLLLSGFSRLEA